MATNIQGNNRCRHIWDDKKAELREAKEERRVSSINKKGRKLLSNTKEK